MGYTANDNRANQRSGETEKRRVLAYHRRVHSQLAAGGRGGVGPDRGRGWGGIGNRENYDGECE